jgi:hypothetical protein
MTGSRITPSQAGLPTPQPTAAFWHREPSATLLGHRTTSDLPPRADVVVVGSGIAGAFAAWYLLGDGRGGGALGEEARGMSVVMLEAREACWGATGRVGGFWFLAPLRLVPLIFRASARLLWSCGE